MRDVGFRLHTVPPFDLPLEGISGHQVFLGPEHAAFVFWGSDPEAALVRASGESDLARRVVEAAEGLRTPRKLEKVFESLPDGGRPETAGRAVAVVVRGTDQRPEPADRAQQLIEGLGLVLERQRLFFGEGVALFVFEQREDAAASSRTLPLAALGDAAPIVPLRPLEVLEQTFWFEAGDQLLPRRADGIIDLDTSASEG